MWILFVWQSLRQSTVFQNALPGLDNSGELTRDQCLCVLRLILRFVSETDDALTTTQLIARADYWFGVLKTHFLPHLFSDIYRELDIQITHTETLAYVWVEHVELFLVYNFPVFPLSFISFLCAIFLFEIKRSPFVDFCH